MKPEGPWAKFYCSTLPRGCGLHSIYCIKSIVCQMPRITPGPLIRESIDIHAAIYRSTPIAI